ncbi:MAG: bifunctional precorrin-2 dehydrogenase/sirohydrochlorin ferrochelatase, partial [Lachnospiraceae bacterium]|nr:bifunctional precorrin-2 dehydrogenase/sirohydrochlorin ferrochelatase [Lachnospiraceae bacterium]
MAFFPMMIRLEDKPVLVIGAGEEGTKKIKILHEFGCIITLIALRAEREAEALANEILYRSFTDSDIADNYVCIVAATDDKRLNRRISDLASERKIP